MKGFDILNPEGPVYQALDWYHCQLIWNLLFLLCCLPVITIGASVSALYNVQFARMDGGTTNCVKRFFTAFRRYGLKATVLWFGILLVGFLCLGWLWIFRVLDPSPVIQILVYTVMAIILCISGCVFPMLASSGSSTVKVIKAAALVTIRRFPCAILKVFSLILLFFILTHLSLRANLQLSCLWLMGGVSTVNYLFCRLFRKLCSVK